MIEFDHLTYAYPDGQAGTPDTGGRPPPVLRDVSLRIAEGDFVVVVGPSGAGKSTLLRCINGLVPHFYGGTVGGRVRVAGRDPAALEPRRMSEVVGFVFQDPEAQAVVNVVEDELAFALENQGLPLGTMRLRVDEVLEQLQIDHLRQRQLSTLSGGERQRVAIASVLTLRPKVLVLDEPTSQLDPQAAQQVLEALRVLNRDLGLTVVLAEHRLERVVQYANRLLYIPGPGQPPLLGDPGEVLAHVPLVPPLVELGKRLNWSPLPLTIEDAGRFVRELRVEGCGLRVQGSGGRGEDAGVRATGQTRKAEGGRSRPVVLEIDGLGFAYNGAPALRGVHLAVRQGEFVALLGPNGAGKTTLLKQCVGLLKPGQGRVNVLGMDTRRTPVEEVARHVGYVPQNPNALLFADTVSAELAFTRRAQGLPPAGEGSGIGDEPLLETLGLSGMRDRYPRDLSVGERQRVALAAVLVGDPDLILLDEPTRGLDYEQKEALASFLQAQKRCGKTILVVSHDVELVAQCAERVLLMDGGEIVVDGPLRQVMNDSPRFASQINRLFRDPRYLTVGDVLEAMP